MSGYSKKTVGKQDYMIVNEPHASISLLFQR